MNEYNIVIRMNVEEEKKLHFNAAATATTINISHCAVNFRWFQWLGFTRFYSASIKSYAVNGRNAFYLSHRTICVCAKCAA